MRQRIVLTVSGVSQGPGWWLASDGRWYPPHLHPRQALPNSVASTPATNWQLKPLRYGGHCVRCGRSIGKGDTGWHDPTISKVMCTECRPVRNGNRIEEGSGSPRDSGVGGTSALRDSRRKGRRATTWHKGAAGEYLMGVTLHERLANGEVILTDRRLPGSQANIDHIVVASSGVWVIDTKNWEGKISYKPVERGSVKMRLTVGGADRTETIEEIYRQVIPVANQVGNPTVPIQPAIAFVECEWSTSLALRNLFRKPIQHERVWISPPRMLTKMIVRPGPLNPESVQRIGYLLDASLPVR